MKFIIEHMEPDVSEWSLLEYKHISEIVGKDNLIFTNVKKDKEKLIDLGKVYEKGLSELGKELGESMCLLDMDSDILLTTDDKNRFRYFVFGGILGDNPRQHRTKVLKDQLKCETRNLGKQQMSTNTAVYVTKKILDGTKFEEIKFGDELEIIMDEDDESGESVILPFRYVVENDKVILPDGLIDYLKNKKSI